MLDKKRFKFQDVDSTKLLEDLVRFVKIKPRTEMLRKLKHGK